MRSSLIEPRPAPGADSSRARSTSDFQRFPMSASAMAQPQRQVTLAPMEGWLSLLLLAVAVYSVVYSVTAAIAITHTTVLWITTAVGLLCGLAVSKIRSLPQSFLHLTSCLVGGWLALLLTSSLAYHDSVLILLNNLREVVLAGFALVGPSNSEMVFLFYLAFLCFFLGYFGSWLVYRAHLPWLVALVYTSIMLVNLNYVTRRDLSFLIVVLASSLILLIARAHLAGQITQWKNDGLYTDHVWLNSISTRVVRIASLFVLLILPLSWFLPVLNQPDSGVTFWNGLDNAWANVTHGHFPTLNDPGSLFSPYQPSVNFFGNDLTITGSVNLPSGPVLTYTSSLPTQGQYLESFAFDQFDGHTWTQLSGASNQQYSANASLRLDLPSVNYSPLQTSVTILQPPAGTRNYIFAPLQPYSFSVPVTLVSDSADIFTSAWTQTSPLSTNEHYVVTSEVPTATPDNLRAIPLPGDDHQMWMTDTNYTILQQNYLQTPASLSPEVKATAQTWTNGALNAYEAALDLQTHLNDSSFTYSVQNPPIPANIDVVTWLLHTRSGYCTYYATAMTIMARLLGLPARIINGFSQGHYDSQQKVWTVNGSDAHSWVQIYFPNYGWINFDPTPGFAVPSQLATNPPPGVSPTPPTVSPSPTATVGNRKTGPVQPTNPAQSSGALSAQENTVIQDIVLAFALIFLLCSLGVLGASIVRYRGSRLPRSATTSIYARLCRLAAVLGSPPAAWQTPYEYTFTLSRRFPEAASTLRRIADLFVRERWASPQYTPAPTEEHDLTRLWPRLRKTILRSPFRKARP